MIDIDPEKMIGQAVDKARACFECGDLDYGREILEQVLRCDPECRPAIQLLGVFYHKARMYAEAIPLFERAIRLSPLDPDNHNNIALCKTSVGDVAGAVESLRTAVDMVPDNPRYRSNLALQYRANRMYAEAVAELETAAGLDDRDPQIWSNLGGVYGETHRLDLAEKSYRTALRVDPGMASAHVDLAYTLHLKGEYAEAWGEYEHRFDFFDNLRPYNTVYDPRNRWRSPSQDVGGKSLILYCEQGLGDAVNFARYVPALKARHRCRVTLHCADVLRPLFEASPALGVDDYITEPVVAMTRTGLPPHDFHASVMSLPHLLNDPVPRGTPYLSAPRRIDLSSYGGCRVGVCWAGSPQHPNDPIRSCHLSWFRGLHDTPGVKLFCLQQDARPRAYRNRPQPVDLTEGSAGIGLVGLGEYLTDFAATAGVAAGLDAVVTVDTALMHLCGALGKRTYGLLAYNPDWRWGLSGDTTPWYDSLTLIRQRHPGDWEGVFQELNFRVKNDLLQGQ